MDKYFTLGSHQSARRGTQGDKKEEGHRGKGVCFSRLHETSPRNDKEVLGVSNTVCTHSPQLNPRDSDGAKISFSKQCNQVAMGYVGGLSM